MWLKGSTVAKHTRLGLRIPSLPLPQGHHRSLLNITRKEKKKRIRVSLLLRRPREQKQHKFKGSLGINNGIPLKRGRKEVNRKKFTVRFWNGKCCPSRQC